MRRVSAWNGRVHLSTIGSPRSYPHFLLVPRLFPSWFLHVRPALVNGTAERFPVFWMHHNDFSALPTLYISRRPPLSTLRNQINTIYLTTRCIFTATHTHRLLFLSPGFSVSVSSHVFQNRTKRSPNDLCPFSEATLLIIIQHLRYLAVTSDLHCLTICLLDSNKSDDQLQVLFSFKSILNNKTENL